MILSFGSVLPIRVLPIVMATTQLRLRPIGLHDVEAVLSFATDPEWARYLPVPQPYLRAHAEQFVASQVLLDRARHPAWAIEHAGMVRGGITLRLVYALGGAPVRE